MLRDGRHLVEHYGLELLGSLGLFGEDGINTLAMHSYCHLVD